MRQDKSKSSQKDLVVSRRGMATWKWHRVDWPSWIQMLQNMCQPPRAKSQLRIRQEWNRQLSKKRWLHLVYRNHLEMVPLKFSQRHRQSRCQLWLEPIWILTSPKEQLNPRSKSLKSLNLVQPRKYLLELGQALSMEMLALKALLRINTKTKFMPAALAL